VDPSQITLMRIEYVGLSMVTCRFIETKSKLLYTAGNQTTTKLHLETLLVVEEFASLEMRSLSIRFYLVNVVAVRVLPSLTFNAPGVKCVFENENRKSPQCRFCWFTVVWTWSGKTNPVI
jgi:hypothetical protein